MRILVFNAMNGIWNGGGESWSINICEHLQRLGHECLLVQGGAIPPSGVSFRTVALNVSVPPFKDPTTKLHKGLLMVGRRAWIDRVNRDNARVTLRAIPHLVAFRPDIIVPVSYFWAVLAAKMVRPLSGYPAHIVFVGHAQGWSSAERDCVRLGIDGFVATQPQAYERARLWERGGTPMTLIPVGVDLDRLATATAIPIPLDKPMVLVVSSLVAYKRVDRAIRAAARAGVSLLVIGDGPLAEEIDALGQSILGPRRFLRLPHVPHSEIAGYFLAADAFTLPSMAVEAFGIVILEAMAAGLPTVVNDDPTRRWITDNRGYFVDPEDTDTFARALSQAATSPRPLIPTSHLAQFSWPAVAAKYVDFFNSILRSYPP